MKYTITCPKLVYSMFDAEENNFTGVVKDRYHHIVFYKNGKIHRTDGPAIIWASGTKEWYIDDICHRQDGPAVEFASGRKDWYINDRRHRIDGPAVEYPNGNKSWYYDGKSYGVNNDFTIESWTKKWLLEIFK